MTNTTTETSTEQSSEHKSQVLVFGASGYIGTNLVPQLLARGYPVRAVARNRKVLETRLWSDVELVEADALKPETLDAALAGVKVAYYLVHSMAAGQNFGQLDLQAAEHFANAAARAGLRRIVYLGGLIPVEADSEHLQSRRDTGERLRAGSVPVTEIRAGIIVGPGSAAFEVIRDLVNNLPFMVTPRWVQSRSTPIALDNLLHYLICAAELDEAAGGIYDAAGPEMLSYGEMMRQLAEVVGKKPLILPVPVLTPKLSSYWLSLVTTVPYNIARALIGGLKHDIPADDRALRELIPQRLLNFKESVSAALEAERSNAVAARWTEGALMFRAYRADYAFYAKRASGEAMSNASVEAVWAQVVAIGGKNRYYYLDILWTCRELLDWMIGGTGLNRGRRHPTQLRLGDIVDSWRVVGMQPPHRLTLQFGMKAPGAGALEFEVEPTEQKQTRVAVTAYWHPAGIWGLLYWYVLAPFHGLIFRGMTRTIAERAEQAERTAGVVQRELS